MFWLSILCRIMSHRAPRTIAQNAESATPYHRRKCNIRHPATIVENVQSVNPRNPAKSHLARFLALPTIVKSVNTPVPEGAKSPKS